MNNIIKTHGLILRKFKAREFDSFFVALTKDYGKVKLFAKSSRKPKAKLGFHLEPGSIAQIYFIPRKRQDNYLLTGAISTWKPNFLKFSASKNRVFHQSLALIERLTTEDVYSAQQILALFNLTKNYLEKMALVKLGDIRLALYQTGLTLKLLNTAGFCLNLKKCANCGKGFSRENNLYYDLESGGVVCCHDPSQSNIAIQKTNFSSIKLANYLLEESPNKIGNLSIEKEVAEKTWRLVLNHLKYCLG
ncbi:MAG: DNA repair protein RecO [Patescibacteria group bacterium]|nr:DNA repair protein RecO [Patescibacteria group bacterium]